MFQKSPAAHADSSHEPETIIAASVKVEGDFASQGNVLIEGVVEGSLRTARDLRVGERARIMANVAAANAVVAGEIVGNLTVGERLELEATAKIHGDVKTKVLVVASGATINGKLSMGTEVQERLQAKADDRQIRASRNGKLTAEPVLAAVEKEEKTFAPFLTR